MEEKKKRIVTKIGNVFCAEIEGTYKMYFHFVDLDRTQLTSDVIRVFKKRYALDEHPKLEDVVAGEVMFYAHVVIAWGIKMGLWEKVGKVKVEEPVRLPFITFHDGNRSPMTIGQRIFDFDFDWRVWYNNEPAQEIKGPLPDEFRHAEWGDVMPPVSIFKRMRDGKYSAHTGKMDRIMALDCSFEHKRDLLMRPRPWSDDEEYQ